MPIEMESEIEKLPDVNTYGDACKRTDDDVTRLINGLCEIAK